MDAGNDYPSATILPQETLERHETASTRSNGDEKENTQAEWGDENIVLTHSHAHAQWRTIAEEFSSLLDKDFVDVVFMVHGGVYLAAHKALVAAVWPGLRDELRNLKLPSVETRIAGLGWVTSGGQAPTLNVPPKKEETSPDSAKLNAEHKQDGMNNLGILDVSGRSWGSWNIVRALFCHLYSRPVAVKRDQLTVLRNTAAALGSSELTRSCDEALERRPRQRSREEPSWLRRDVSAVSGSTTGATGPYTPSSSFVVENLESTLATGRSTPERKNNPGLKPFDDKGDELRGNEARPRSRLGLKPTGEASFHREETSNRSEEGGGIRHVLSDLKRSIVNSSRVISDKKFQQVYEMVPGEGGILGEGINGPVRMATSKRNGRQVAVKRISCVNLSEQRRQMLLSEIRIFLQVSHRNIIQLYEVYESEVDQAVLLVMELCTGKELFERLAECKYYSEFDAARVTKQMLEAVSYLHSQNICHRDLKLENWLYENPSHDAKLKLCDFGFGQIVEPSVQLTATLGSLFYVAPEVLEGSYGLPCDMWSMGVIVYMLLSGNPPFDGKTDADVIHKIKQGKFGTYGKRWEGISESAKQFLHSVLRKDPYERLSASEAVQSAWLHMEGISKRMPAHLSSKDQAIDQNVIRDILKFSKNNAIARAAIGMLSSSGSASTFHGTEEDVMCLEKEFKRIDGQNTGRIDAEEFTKVLKESTQLSSADATKVFERIAGASSSENANATGDQQTRRKREVNYSEFLTLTKAKRVATNSAAIREAFRAFDKDGEGLISDNAIRGMLTEGFKADEELIKTTLQKCDISGAGLIDYVNFANVFSEELSKKEKEKRIESDCKEASKEATVVKEGEPCTISVESMEAFTNEKANAKSPAISEESATPVNRGDAAFEQRRSQTSESLRFDSKACSPRSTKSPHTGDEGHQDEEDENEEHWDDFEEQLVSVTDKVTSQAPNETPKETKGVAEKLPSKNSHIHQSLALSLAGSAEHDDHPVGVNRIISLPSDVYSIRQLPGFHKEIMKPFYGDRPVSNVVMGLIRGTSLYAKQCVNAKLATIIHTNCGWYFLMPNPKYHTELNDRKGLLSKVTGQFRFVAWWIHPRFVPQLRQWFERMTEGKDDRWADKKKLEKMEKTEKDRLEKTVATDNTTINPEGISSEDPPPSPKHPDAKLREKVTGEVPLDVAVAAVINSQDRPMSPEMRSADEKSPRARNHTIEDDNRSEKKADAGRAGDRPAQRESQKEDPQLGMGSPGDFQFSDVPKPENYLHTYRDLHTREHVVMLNQLNEGVLRFLRTLFDESFLSSAHISAGFHYPVRTQYATLHMQVRVNSGSVCRDDGRGVDIQALIEKLQGDRLKYHRDDEAFRYQVTENIKVSLLAAANEYAEEHPECEVVRQTAALGYDLGMASMPTIKDEGEEDGQDDELDEDALGEYIINMQPSADTPFCSYLYQKRAEMAETFGKDPSYLYPLHVSVTGFFEATKARIEKVVAMVNEILAEELAELRGNEAVQAKEVISVNAGYVLMDLEAPHITEFAKSLSLRAKDLGLNIRPKAVNHISLAMGRPDAEQRRQIQDMYASDPNNLKKEATFDLVVSRRTFRGSFDKLDVEGPHQFREVARIGCATAPSRAEPLPPPIKPEPPVVQVGRPKRTLSAQKTL